MPDAATGIIGYNSNFFFIGVTMFESAILYLALCTLSGDCRWEYAGTYQPSFETQVRYGENRSKSVEPKFSGMQMCQQASRELGVSSGKWKCLNGGYQSR